MLPLHPNSPRRTEFNPSLIMPSKSAECAAPGVQRLAGKYLTLVIRRESYGIDVLQVREIIRMTNITARPRHARRERPGAPLSRAC